MIIISFDYFLYITKFFTYPFLCKALHNKGHIESFHSILSRHLSPCNFWSIKDLEENLVLFYDNYNNRRIHASTAYTPPAVFWKLWELGQVEKTIDLKKRKIKFKLKIPHHQIAQLTGNNELEGSSLHDFKPLEEAEKSNKKEMVSAETSHNLRYKKSPSVVPCDAKIKDF